MTRTYANSTVTSDQVGLKRDMAKVIEMISPQETVFTTMIGKGKKIKAVDPEWQTDKLRDANPTGAAQQGKKAAPTGARQPDELKNHTHIFEEAISVSGTAETVGQYNISKKLGRERMLRAREMKLDIEARALGNYRSVKAAGNTAGEFAGYGAWLKTNVLAGVGASDGGFDPATGLVSVRSAGTLRPLTEALFKDAVRMAWDEGGNPTHVFANSKNKQTISGFGGIATQYRDNKGTKHATILGAAGVYVSDFDTHFIHASRHSPITDVEIVDISKFKIRDLRGYNVKPLGRTGDSTEEQLLRECTMQCTDEKASALITDILVAA